MADICRAQIRRPALSDVSRADFVPPEWLALVSVQSGGIREQWILRSLLRVNNSSENFETLDQARARSAEIGVAIERVHIAGFDRR
jgi:hypothetical protein